jgi:hypothetical protein
MLTSSFSSFLTVPEAALRWIHGSSVVAVNPNGWSPRLKTSMVRVWRL